MINKIKLLLILPVVLLLASCNALKISEANQALSNHYFAKESAREKFENDKTTVSNLAIIESMSLALQDLAIETKQRADEESDVKNRIAFYRISATAAWQSGTLKASDFSTQGHKLCQSEKGIEEMNVHCGMLAFIPLFSSVDKNTDRVHSLEMRIKAAKKARDTEALKPLQTEAQAIFDEYKTALSAGIITKKAITNYQLSDGFIAQVDANLRDIACNKLSQTNALLSQANGMSVPNESIISEMKEQLGTDIVGDCSAAI
ncbi:hypothetical protein [Glaciecola sp. MF2-115]|uniref:hypothetical protein n=1 Tax=Glaciecola sp. MF2-115 TaxID=3384827 RepID=UPI0039A09991